MEGIDNEVPMLVIPKSCTSFELHSDVTDNVLIDLNITTPDTEGNTLCFYSGLCNIKLIDSYEVSIRKQPDIHDPDDSDDDDSDDDDSTLPDEPIYNQNVWIDPSRSPYVYNHCGNMDQCNIQQQECYSVCRESHTSITVDQCNTYITKNVYEEAILYSYHESMKNKKSKKRPTNQPASSGNLNEDDKFECGVFPSHLPEDIMIEKQNRAREEQKYIGIQSENSALRQLMSPDIQSLSRQQKTILFLGHDEASGQTIQQIGYYDPNQECYVQGVDNENTVDVTDPPNKKRYQCAKCHHIFDQIADFREHTGSHRAQNRRHSSPEILFTCKECGKNFKTKEKFDNHCAGHGDPDLECSKCHKVYATKGSLRIHKKIHARKFPCSYCPKSYTKIAEMQAHVTLSHPLFKCENCDFATAECSILTAHQKTHENFHDSSETEPADSIFGDIMSDDEMKRSPDPDWSPEKKDSKIMVKYEENQRQYDESKRKQEREEADKVIATVMSNKMFLGGKTKKYKGKIFKKVCDLCCKSFVRLSDLKRHLIQHVVRSTLAKCPVNPDGTLTMRCEVCQSASFSKVDRYKAHLREHAKLTIYKCTFCNKCFSDSSNFSKHKKVHGSKFFQCDLCQRKFNSKMRLTSHMDYHNQNEPMKCYYCDKEFHFESTLNKHLKNAHTQRYSYRYRCGFCEKYFQSVKVRWEHEWSVHNVRKMIADCLICEAKFRKYIELKKHCQDRHGIDIPTAKRLLMK